jgi:glyoxylase-like metal-dependent hydrolase (beta-lactamase superfamily II)
MTEADLADLGIHRIPIPIPFPQAGGPVNVYAVEEAGGGILLWDAGLGAPDAEAALEDGLRRLGRRLGDVTRILVSHGHIDHFGAARFVQERHGGAPPVFIHPADAGKVTEAGETWAVRAPLYSAHLARLGVPPDAVARAEREGERTYSFARRLPRVEPLRDGEVVRTRHLALTAHHMPGHTPGLVVLHDPERRLLLSADHLLERVSPNPLIELGPKGEAGYFRPLLSYLASVERTRALEVDLVLPGHGPPFGGHRAVIDGMLAFYGRRQERIRALLAAGPRTPWELARELFPKAPAGQTFLVVSETVANLEVMEARGELVRAEGGGVERFGLA